MTTDIRYARDLAQSGTQESVQADLPAQYAPHLPHIDDDALLRAFKVAAQRDLDLAKQVWESQLPFKEKAIGGKAWKDTPARERFAFVSAHEPLYEPRILGAIRDALFAVEMEQYQVEVEPLMLAMEIGEVDPATTPIPPAPVRDGYLAELDQASLMGLEPALTEQLMQDPTMGQLVANEWLQSVMSINRREVADRLLDYARLEERYGRSG